MQVKLPYNEKLERRAHIKKLGTFGGIHLFKKKNKTSWTKVQTKMKHLVYIILA